MEKLGLFKKLNDIEKTLHSSSLSMSATSPLFNIFALKKHIPNCFAVTLPTKNINDVLIDKAKITEQLNNVNKVLLKIFKKDKYTNKHVLMVAKYAEILAKEIKLTDENIKKVKISAMLHDVGKISIPNEVLQKEGTLTDIEWQTMKKHSELGALYIEKNYPNLKEYIPGIKYHHEKWDGTGYPSSLKGAEIPLEARIIAIVDTYHALTEDRIYRKKMTNQEAINVLKKGAGSQWDADLVKHFINALVKTNNHKLTMALV